jgi:hypothetical protein
MSGVLPPAGRQPGPPPAAVASAPAGQPKRYGTEHLPLKLTKRHRQPLATDAISALSICARRNLRDYGSDAQNRLFCRFVRLRGVSAAWSRAAGRKGEFGL